MYEDESVWSRKGALLTDFLARTEFGLSQPEIYAAVHAGKLQCQIGQDQYGPHLQLLRHEVEALVAEKRQRGSPPPNTQLLELALGELDETLVNIIAFLCLDSPRAFGGSIHDILEAYHHMLAWIAQRGRSLTSPHPVSRYTLLAGVKEEVQALLRGGRQRLRQIDIPNSQWTFLAWIMREDGVECPEYFRACERGELYECVASCANTTREKAKRELSQRVLYSANRDTCQESKIKQAFDQLFPEVAGYLYEAKEHGDESGLARLVRRNESGDGKILARRLKRAQTDLLVKRVCGRLRRERRVTFMVRVLDCLMFVPPDGDYVQAVLEKEFRRMGIRARVEVKDL